MSKAALLEKLTDKEYRDAFVSEEIDTGIPMQLRSMRESRGWNQSFVAEKTGTKQPRFSLMEKPGYGNFTLNTLKKLASLFDVGLIVSFVPFSEMIDFVEGITPSRLHAIAFADEYQRLQRRYSRAHHDGTVSAQTTFNFGGSNNTAFDAQRTVFASTSTTSTLEPKQDAAFSEVPLELLIANAATADATISV